MGQQERVTIDKEWVRPAQIFIAGLYFFFLVFLALRITSVEMVPTGDETHYLVVAHSLAFDHDLSLLNNYQERHYRVFYPGELAKRTSPSADRKRELPAQGLGPSILLAPFYRAAYSISPALIVPVLRIIVCSITAIVLYQLFLLGALLGCSFRARAVIAGAAGLASPLLTYSSQFYPEIFACLLVLIAVRQLFNLEEHRWAALLWLALIPGALVWLHPKYVALSAVIFVFSLIRIHKTFRVYRGADAYFLQIVYFILAIAGTLSFFLFLYSQYGGWSPNRIYAGWESQPVSLIDLIRREGFQRIGIMLRMAVGFWIDQRFGLIPYAPIYGAFFTAIVVAIRTAPSVIAPIVVLLVVHFSALCWGAPLGGFAPPSRHMVVLIPLILAPLFVIYERWKAWQVWIFIALTVPGFVVSFLMFSNYRLLFSNVTWHNRDGFSPFWQHLGPQNWIPSLTTVHLQAPLILYWISILILLSFILFPWKPKEATD